MLGDATGFDQNLSLRKELESFADLLATKRRNLFLHKATNKHPNDMCSV